MVSTVFTESKLSSKLFPQNAFEPMMVHRPQHHKHQEYNISGTAQAIRHTYVRNTRKQQGYTENGLFSSSNTKTPSKWPATPHASPRNFLSSSSSSFCTFKFWAGKRGDSGADAERRHLPLRSAARCGHHYGPATLERRASRSRTWSLLSPWGDVRLTPPPARPWWQTSGSSKRRTRCACDIRHLTQSLHGKATHVSETPDGGDGGGSDCVPSTTEPARAENNKAKAFLFSFERLLLLILRWLCNFGLCSKTRS